MTHLYPPPHGGNAPSYLLPLPRPTDSLEVKDKPMVADLFPQITLCALFRTYHSTYYLTKPEPLTGLDILRDGAGREWGPLLPEGSASGPAHPTQPNSGLVIQPLLSPKAPGLIRQLHTFRFSLPPVWVQAPVLTRILASALMPSGSEGVEVGE